MLAGIADSVEFNALVSDPQPQNILLVDPDHDYLEWATKHLEVDGVKVIRCDDAQKALKVAQNMEIDLIICDLKLEPFNGLELLSKIRAASPQTVVVLTAAFPTTGQIIESTQKGAHEVLRKESLAFELRGVVEAALQLVDQRRESSPNEDERQDVGKNSSRIRTLRSRKRLLHWSDGAPCRTL